jgi:hypothetical protein
VRGEDAEEDGGGIVAQQVDGWGGGGDEWGGDGSVDLSPQLGGAPVGAGEGTWRRPLDLRREEGCSCSMRGRSEEGEAR